MSNVILIGYMGSGKSTIGKKLSYALRQPFVDTDKLIEARQGRTVSEIFAADGEEAFRDMETQCIESLFENKQDYVIAVGGGLPLRAENRALLQKLGKVVYLRAKPETIYQRLKGDTTRPLLQGADPEQKIADMIAVRGPYYEEGADCIVDVDGLDFGEILDKIKTAVGRQKERRDGWSAGREERRQRRMKMLIINGPNLNFLGIREPEIYGRETYDDLKAMIKKHAGKIDVEVTFFQSNHEGAIIDRIQEAYYDGTGAIVINPGAFTHYSYAIHDALQSITTMPKVEIHISDITKREGFRAVSVTKPACDAQIYGKGFAGYLEAMDRAIELAAEKN